MPPGRFSANSEIIFKLVHIRVVTQFACGDSEELPAQETGGLYKTKRTDALRFCSGLSAPFTVNRALRDGEGTFLFKLSHHAFSNSDQSVLCFDGTVEVGLV